MIYSVIYEYKSNDGSAIIRRRANVRASCPETCRKKVSDFFLQSHAPDPSFRIESVKELFSVNFLIV